MVRMKVGDKHSINTFPCSMRIIINKPFQVILHGSLIITSTIIHNIKLMAIIVFQGFRIKTSLANRMYYSC